jgi:hypothetical protein
MAEITWTEQARKDAKRGRAGASPGASANGRADRISEKAKSVRRRESGGSGRSTEEAADTTRRRKGPVGDPRYGGGHRRGHRTSGTGSDEAVPVARGKP